MFDWVHVQDSLTDTGVYVPAKVLLLYRFGNRDFALCWKATPATGAERKRETNICARWRMQFGRNGLPEISSVPTERLEQTLFVYQHFHNSPHHFPQDKVSLEDQASKYVIQEAYERYSWALNYLDPNRWNSNL